MNQFRFLKPVLYMLMLVSISQVALADSDTSNYICTDNYRIKDGKVDPATFLGYNIFHSVCVGCHDVGGGGTDVAPDLTKSIKQLSPNEFQLKVLHRYAVKFSQDDWMLLEEEMLKEIIKQKRRDQGKLESMPRWESNPFVKDNVQNIYRYLKARSDGVLGPDKPGLLKE